MSEIIRDTCNRKKDLIPKLTIKGLSFQIRSQNCNIISRKNVDIMILITCFLTTHVTQILCFENNISHKPYIFVKNKSERV